MHFMIHACPSREWYVKDFLIPSMTAQGIPRDDIEVWMDRDGDGCLFSCMKSFAECGKQDPNEGTWHLQDDVLICRDFAKRCAEHDEGLVSGFGSEKFGPTMSTAEKVPAIFIWFSFQCTRIPNWLAGECADWFFNDAIYRDSYREMVESRKCDDSFFYDYITEAHVDDLWGYNMKPCLVEHVDRLIGGSAVNQWRPYWARAAYWDDESLIEELKRELARRK